MKRTTKTPKMATVLAVSAIATTCFVGGTLARYKTTGNTTSDSVRTAKWTFTADNLAQIDISNLFVDDNSTDMLSANTDKIMAPSAGGSIEIDLAAILNAAANGTETGYTVKLTAEGSESLTSPDDDPIIYTLAQGDGAAQEYNTITELASAISAVSPTKTAAGSLTGADKLTIGWEWKNDEANNASDTALGADGTLKAELSLTAEVSQNID